MMTLFVFLAGAWCGMFVTTILFAARWNDDDH